MIYERSIYIASTERVIRAISRYFLETDSSDTVLIFAFELNFFLMFVFKTNIIRKHMMHSTDSITKARQ
jgi:hypothetical protein